MFLKAQAESAISCLIFGIFKYGRNIGFFGFYLTSNERRQNADKYKAESVWNLRSSLFL
jgi:hypothetical protein